jgi:hypothetical protein
MNHHPVIIKMISDERIRQYTTGPSRAAALEWTARRRMGSIRQSVWAALTHLLHRRVTALPAGSAQCCPAT